jgi:DNA invertase Pin-like site-specific DNA recombinase
MRAAIYVRVSRLDQHPENQIAELRRFAAAYGWEASEFVEHGVSGAKDRRPQLDAMMAAVRRKKFDAVVCWKLDRLGRDMHHLIGLMNELRALGVEFVATGKGIDTRTPNGRMLFGILASIAEFERERLRERTLLGLDRARQEGKNLGRPRKDAAFETVAHLSVRKAAAALGVSTGAVQRARRNVGSVQN